MRIGYLGAGTWGFCLASLLASNGHQCTVWARDKDLAALLQKEKEHPDLPGSKAMDTLRFTTHMEEALEGAELIVESVTSAGIRPVFEKVKQYRLIDCPIVLTSKGIEQNTELLLSEVLVHVLGEEAKPWIGCLTGPSHAEEVIKNIPTSVVASAYHQDVIYLIQNAFRTPTFRIYANTDIHGVQFGGAMKNIIAIACGISDGLGFGDNTKAALITRGLHEMRKLSSVKGARPDTFNGLAGLGDLCATCLSTLSRNYRFGRLVAEGYSPPAAKEKIAVAIEGAYTCFSAIQMGRHHRIDIPITDAVDQVINKGISPFEATKRLMTRVTKEEHL